MNDGTLIDGVVRIDDLRPRETKKGIDGNKDDTNGVVMNGAPPLEIVVCSK